MDILRYRWNFSIRVNDQVEIFYGTVFYNDSVCDKVIAYPIYSVSKNKKPIDLDSIYPEHKNYQFIYNNECLFYYKFNEDATLNLTTISLGDLSVKTLDNDKDVEVFKACYKNWYGKDLTIFSITQKLLRTLHYKVNA